MFYLFILTIFSLFIGLNNVSAYSFDENNRIIGYLDSRFSTYDISTIKNFVDNHSSFESSDGTKYVFDDYNSFIFPSFWGNPSDDYFINDTYFGDEIYFEGISPDNSNYFFVSSKSLYQVSRQYSVFSTWQNSSFTTVFSLYPIYTKNVKVAFDYFIKLSKSDCDNFGNFCANASEPDNYGQVLVQVGWKDGELKGFLNLAGEIAEVSTNYTVNIYLDDKFQESYSDIGTVGSKIILKGLDNDKLRADENNKYEVVLVDGENNFELRYYTSTYGTINQQISTDNTELPLPFSYDKLKEMFPGINFELWTSYEQFNFVLMFNLFFILFLFFIVFILFRIFYFIKGWFF